MMKRNIALLLAAIIASSMISCGGSKEPTDDTSANTDTDTAATETIAAETETDAPAAESNTPAVILFGAFKDYIAANPDATANDIATALSQNEILPFNCVAMPAEEGYLGGFSTEITGFTECTSFAPMIGSIPFVGYVFTVDEANVESFKETLTANYDLRWNICVEAEEMLCDSVGDKVFFIMANKSFES
ncbi:MAG: hypothetical protein ACI3XM_03250 [Eubacteriales bacterium]